MRYVVLNRGTIRELRDTMLTLIVFTTGSIVMADAMIPRTE